MGLPLEQWRGDEAEGGEEEQAAGCRTPRRAQATMASGAGTVACPPAPRKRGPVVAASAAGAVAQRKEFYSGADLEAFFAAHNL